MKEDKCYRGKRAFDVCCAATGLMVLWPVLLALAVAVRMTSEGPAIYRQERVGREGRRIRVWKFRTMVLDADTLSRETLGTSDPRITEFGRFLRKTKLDELPQLVNVLKGEMSMVGPRPEIPYYADGYSRSDSVVLSVRPGITDPSSLELSNLDDLMEARGDASAPEFYVTVIQPKKLALQKDYIHRQSFRGDLVIILRTLAKVLKP